MMMTAGGAGIGEWGVLSTGPLQVAYQGSTRVNLHFLCAVRICVIVVSTLTQRQHSLVVVVLFVLF